MISDIPGSIRTGYSALRSTKNDPKPHQVDSNLAGSTPQVNAWFWNLKRRRIVS